MQVIYLAHPLRNKYQNQDYLGLLRESIENQFDVRLAEEDMHYGYEISCVYDALINEKKFELRIEQIIYDEKSFVKLLVAFKNKLEDSDVFEVKKKLIDILLTYYKGIIVQIDEHNKLLSNKLYEKIHDVENRMRILVNTIMVHEFGLNWFEEIIKVRRDDILNPSSNWYESKYRMPPNIKKTVYNLYFLEILEILIDNTSNPIKMDLYKEIKELKKKTDRIDTNIIKSIDKPKSLWEEHFEKYFTNTFYDEWKDLNKRRNVIAHNKLLTKEFFEETNCLLDKKINELEKISELINKTYDRKYIEFIERVVSQEIIEAQVEYEYEERLLEQANLSRFSFDSFKEYVENDNRYVKFLDTLINYFEEIDLKTEDLYQRIVNFIDKLNCEDDTEDCKKCIYVLDNIQSTIYGSQINNPQEMTDEDIYNLFEERQEHVISIFDKYVDSRPLEYYKGFNIGKVVEFKDIFGNVLMIEFEGEFDYYRGGVNYFTLNVTHKLKDSFKKDYLDFVGTEDFKQDDYPFNIVLEITNNVVSIKGSMSMTYGDYEIVDSAAYPIIDDILDIDFFFVEKYLEKYFDYLDKMLDVMHSYI